MHVLEKGKLYGEFETRRKAEVKSSVIPQLPAHFEGKNQEIWEFYANILAQYGLFTIANAPILEVLTTITCEYYSCLEHIAKEGIIVITENNMEKTNPYWISKNRCIEIILKCLNSLGLSSVGLAKLGSLDAKQKKEKTKFEKLLQ